MKTHSRITEVSMTAANGRVLSLVTPSSLNYVLVRLRTADGAPLFEEELNDDTSRAHTNDYEMVVAEVHDSDINELYSRLRLVLALRGRLGPRY